MKKESTDIGKTPGTAVAILLSCLVLLSGLALFFCVSHPDTGRVIPAHGENIPCAVYHVLSADRTSGTAFAISEQGQVMILTAAHIVRDADVKHLSVISTCTSKTLKVQAIHYLPNLDAAALVVSRKADVVALRFARHEPYRWATVHSPNHAEISKVSPRPGMTPMSSAGNYIGTQDGRLLVTLDIVRGGSSGAPILDFNGDVIGLLTHMVLREDKRYSGFAMAVDRRSLRDALGPLLPSIRHGSNGKTRCAGGRCRSSPAMSVPSQRAG